MDDLISAFERLKTRIEVDGNGCWIWQGALSRDMYGAIKVGEKAMSTHRLAYRVVNGEIPRGKVIRHRCDVRQCCNPEHLVVGDHEDNTQDTVDRGRTKARRVLSAEELAVVVTMRSAGSTKRQIAEALKCAWQVASDAIDATEIDAPKRSGRPKGSRNLRVRVTEEAKAEMCALYATGLHTQTSLAERFGCDQTYVSLIVRGLK